ncbi:32955_t:CDS:2, partial [Gigaspora margarita]
EENCNQTPVNPPGQDQQNVNPNQELLHVVLREIANAFRDATIGIAAATSHNVNLYDLDDTSYYLEGEDAFLFLWLGTNCITPKTTKKSKKSESKAKEKLRVNLLEYEDEALEEAEGFFTEEISDDEIFWNP